MKILHVAPLLSVGGVSRLMSEIIPLMNQKIDEAAFLINRCDNPTFLHKFKDGNVNVISLDNPNYFNPLYIIRIARIIRDYDLIHVHLFPSLYLVALANVLVGKPLVYTEHNTKNKRRNKSYLRYIERLIYSRYCNIISISHLTEVNLRAWLKPKRDDKRFIIINNGVALEDFKNCRHVSIYPHTLIMIARFAPAKDQATIIRAMRLLAKDIHLILVGDGDNKNNCQRLAEEIGVSEKIHFVGTQSDIPGWISKADIGIQSSIWEGFGLTAVEMMAGGLPVVASDVDGLRQVVDGAGVLFPCGDETKLAEIVTRLLSDKDYYNDIRQKCLMRCKKYDIRRMVHSYLKVYNNILEK